MAEQQGPVVGRFYTTARRIPMVIGKIQGWSIPGGPYSTIQFGAATGVGFVLIRTTGLWARFGLIGNVAIFIMVVVGVLFALRFVPNTGRNPLTAVLDGVRGLLGTGNPYSLGASLLRALTRATWIRVHGHLVLISRPHRVHHRVRATHPAEGSALAPVRAASAPVDPAPTPAVALTGVAELLARAVRQEEPCKAR